ncbi:MAG TPA: hypothetical protein VNT75_29545 [Symbiobacteriaceae bacterium]|nr:hypothetical protein [Symbiobacteriaceae bacterium]
MATTIDTISSLAHSSWRDAATRAARSRVSRIPDTALRSRQVGYAVMDMGLTRTWRESGIAAYSRQQEFYDHWKEAASSRPVRSVPVPGPDRAPAQRGALLDVKL